MFPFGETNCLSIKLSSYSQAINVSCNHQLFTVDVRPHVPKDRLLAIVHQVGIWPRLLPLPRRAMDSHAVKAVPVQKN